MGARDMDGAGHSADRPSEIPKAGWWDVLLRVKARIGDASLGVVSAGVAFNEFFALFPALVAAVSVYGLVADAATVEAQMAALTDVLPAQAREVIAGQLRSIAGAPSPSLGLSTVISLLVALWGAARGIKAMIEGLNLAYDENEKRGFFRLNLTAVGFTFAAVVFGAAALTLVAGLPVIIGLLPLGDAGRLLVSLLRWPLLAMFLLAGLAVVYRYGPSRERPRWRWVSWGAALAAVLWLVGSAAFSLYVANFGKLNETYGSMAAVAVLLLWFQLTSFVVLLGALLDAELEHQTARDTTEGPPRPLGRRGARMADRVAARSR
jgi:membrane protein